MQAPHVSLGRLEPVAVREYWKDEAAHFTPWLADEQNLVLLSEAVGLELAFESQEHAVGPYSADIVCTTPDSHRVIIENQFGRTDHDHLGKLLTYAGGVDDTRYVIWVAEQFTEQHRAALDWLNSVSDEDTGFFGVEIQLWRIADSPAAPRFNVIAMPNEWQKAVRTRPDQAVLSESRRERLEFWESFHQFIEQRGFKLRVSRARPETWLTSAAGHSGFLFNLVMSNYDLREQEMVGGIVTRVEFVMFDANADSYFRQLRSVPTLIEQQIDDLTWYAQAQKERKLFVQQVWRDATRAEWPGLHEWLAVRLELFRRVFVPLVRELANGNFGASDGTEALSASGPDVLTG